MLENNLRFCAHLADSLHSADSGKAAYTNVPIEVAKQALVLADMTGMTGSLPFARLHAEVPDKADIRLTFIVPLCPPAPPVLVELEAPVTARAALTMLYPGAHTTVQGNTITLTA